MIKTLARSIKQEKENFRIPHSVQDVIPIRRIWLDGIFQAGNAYSRSYRLTDINYAIASKADKTAMLLDYSELLNALDSGACAKITINNRRVDRRQFEQELLIRPQEDKLNEYRQEYNDMLRSHAASNNNVVQERYLTINAHKRSVDEARAYFQRMGGEVTARLGQLSSQAEELDASARLQILRDFFKAGQPAVVPFNMEQRAKRGHDFKDWFCPDSLEFYADFFKSDVRWGRVLYLQDYASFIKDDFIMEKTILLKNAGLLDEEANCILNQNVYVQEGKILKILPAAEDTESIHADETIDCSKYYVSPGLANLHTHTAMNIFKGIAEDVTADAWFNEMIWPYESKMTDEDIYVGTLMGIAEMINNGVTVFADHYFGEEQVLKAVKETGIRGDLAPTLFGMTPDFHERLAQVKAFIQEHRNDSDRISFHMGPHANYTCPSPTLKEIIDESACPSPCIRGGCAGGEGQRRDRADSFWNSL